MPEQQTAPVTTYREGCDECGQARDAEWLSTLISEAAPGLDTYDRGKLERWLRTMQVRIGDLSYTGFDSPRRDGAKILVYIVGEVVERLTAESEREASRG